MKHYQHSLAIAASPAAVYAALSTIDGLRGWWSQDCDGSTAVGDTIHFRFGTCYKDMRVQRLEPGREVRWHCTRAHVEADSVTRPDEWVGTEPVFRISDAGQGRTQLAFEHVGLLPSLSCYGVCSQGWQHFLGSLQQYLETGTGAPYIPLRTPQPQSMTRRTAA
jgi:uncharacterized protein YndB with AHSA1/START domain